ncbi:Bestrophin-3 [Manis pentadactyla]|nr:Bestrophin-3 [Manis pentadactyla]
MWSLGLAGMAAAAFPASGAHGLGHTGALLAEPLEASTNRADFASDEHGQGRPQQSPAGSVVPPSWNHGHPSGDAPDPGSCRAEGALAGIWSVGRSLYMEK